MQGTRSACIEQKAWYAHKHFARYLFLRTLCRLGSREVHLFDLLVLSEVPGVVLCFCAQGEGILSPASPAHQKGTALPRKHKFHHHAWSSGDHHRQYQA